jgi:hypothetical protein
MKTSEAVNLANAIATIQNRNVTAKPKFGYALFLNAKNVLPIVEGFEASRRDLITANAKKDDNNEVQKGVGENGAETVQLDESKIVEFNAALTELLNTEVDVLMTKISIDLFPDIEPGLINLMAPMIEELA